MAAPVVIEDQVLKVHTARDGQVWYVDGGHEAINTHAAIDDFLTTAAYRRARHVRMVGSAANARALCLLYNLKLDGQLPRLEVAGPAAVGRTRAERDDPRMMLVRIRGSAADGLNPAMGGWHEFVADDYPAYAIAACDAYDGTTFDVPTFRMEMLSAHPAWPALSFISHLDLHRLARLLGIVLDPRWYTSLRTPLRGDDIVPYHADAAKLHAYLGLDPRTMAGVLGYCPETGSAARCRLVYETWSAVATSDGCERGHPAYFLWRRYRREVGPVKAALRASQMFVDYLRLVWLDALYCDWTGAVPAAPGKRPPGEGLFAPEHFFAHEAEADAYRRHRASLAGG
jgi:hypothetical protein